MAQRPVEISFAIACFNGLPHLRPAVQSALSQTDIEVEVIVVDDGSSDGSIAYIRDLALSDPRVVLLQTPSNMGPGGARNLAIEEMKGDWLSVLDADDLIEPYRSRRLIDAAQRLDADLVADDLLVFGEHVAETRFLSGNWPISGDWMTFERYLTDSVLFGRAPNPGFLKPIFHRRLFADPTMRYNPELRIGEDDELVMRMLHSGARYLIVPEPGYRYRKHEASISHRLSPANCRRMVEAENALRQRFEASGPLPRAYHKRWKALLEAQSFVCSIEQLQNRRFFAAAKTLLAHPSAIRLYRMPIFARFQRLVSRLLPQKADEIPGLAD